MKVKLVHTPNPLAVVADVQVSVKWGNHCCRSQMVSSDSLSFEVMDTMDLLSQFNPDASPDQ